MDGCWGRSLRRVGKHELRCGVCAVMAKGEVFSIEANEQIGEDEDHDQGRRRRG